METLLTTIFSSILKIPGLELSSLLMLGIMIYLYYHNKAMSKEIKEAHALHIKILEESKEAEKKIILDIVDKYHRGNIDVTEALQEIRIVLATIQGKL